MVEGRYALAEEGPGAFFVRTSGFLAEGFGPKTIAMTVVGAAFDVDVACVGHGFADCMEVLAEFGIDNDAD